MPELRKDPITGRWVIISTNRGKRPSDFVRESVQIKGVGMCPFCPGNEGKTPSEVLAYGRNGSGKDTPGWSLRVVPNKFPALGIEGGLDREGEGLFDRMNGVGAHEVIIETPDHRNTLATMPQRAVEETLWAYRDRILDLKNDRRFRYILLFKNHGEPAGATQEHTHSQLIALPIVPKRVREEVDNSRHYYDEKERCIFCDMIRQEIETESRVILSTDHFIALAPYAPRFPFETWILPRQHSSSFENMPTPNYGNLAHSPARFPRPPRRRARVPVVQLRRAHLAHRRGNQRSLSLAHRDDAQADEGRGIRVGHRLLHQSHAPRRSRPLPARSAVTIR